MSQYNLFGRKPLQYADISEISCTACGWCAKFCPMECILQRPDGTTEPLRKKPPTIKH